MRFSYFQADEYLNDRRYTHAVGEQEKVQSLPQMRSSVNKRMYGTGMIFPVALDVPQVVSG